MRSLSNISRGKISKVVILVIAEQIHEFKNRAKVNTRRSAIVTYDVLCAYGKSGPKIFLSLFASASTIFGGSYISTLCPMHALPSSFQFPHRPNYVASYYVKALNFSVIDLQRLKFSYMHILRDICGIREIYIIFALYSRRMRYAARAQFARRVIIARDLILEKIHPTLSAHMILTTA